jgi:hypothetical protein
MRLGAISAVAIAVLAIGIPSCGLEAGGSGSPDASTGDAPIDTGNPDVEADAGGDVPAPDVSCSVASCNGVCVDSCSGCTAGESLCPETRVCGCAGCAGKNVECFSCTGASRIGFCVADPDSCSPASPCPCNDNPASCPGAGNQVCTSSGSGGSCLPCGANGTDDKPCKDGKQCEDDASASCR